MSKFNTTTSGKTVVENYMGGKSFKQTKKEELAFAVITSFMEDSYYESKDNRIARIADLVKEIAKSNPLFVAKLAIVTRREFHMRSAFHVLLGELVKNHNGDSLVQNTIVQGVERPDDLLEITAYINGGKKPIPNQVKKGIAKATHKFDSYQFAKYRGEDKEYSMVDLFNLTRPKPLNVKEKEAFKALMKGVLKSTETWEAKLSSEEGRKDKGATWKELLEKNKLGYMALLKNLRNIAENCDSETVQKAADQITNWVAIKYSKQLPFRFLSAYQALVGETNLKSGSIQFEKDVDNFTILANAVNEAITMSCQNIPDLPGKTVILTDNSGSMRGDCGGSSLVSAFSHRTSADIANLFAVMYWMKSENTYVGVFGDRLKQPVMDRTKSLFENFKIIDEVGKGIGGNTESGAFQAFRQMIAEKTKVDRVVTFTDCQLGEENRWYGQGIVEQNGNFNALFQKFRKINPEARFYNVDLRGLGTTLYSDGIVNIAGWTDKIFEIMEKLEKGKGLVKWIEEYPVQLL